MTFVSHAQAGQDLFAFSVCPDGTTFLDVGCGHPTKINNTYALEELGWRGLLVDNSVEAVEACTDVRRSPALHGDAVSMDWNAALRIHLGKWNGRPTDYLSLDVDEATAKALSAILNEGAVFAAITVEHDAYRHGDLLRAPIRKRLEKHDYELIAADVHHDGMAFEDWFVMPDFVDMAVASRFRSEGLDWREVLKLGGV